MSRALGNARESAVADSLDTFGYHVIKVSASGSRGAHLRKRKHPVIGDLIAIPSTQNTGWLPPLQVEVKGLGGRASAELRELQSNALPGFSPMVVIFRNRKRIYYTTCGRYTTLAAALSGDGAA